jgi:hypothetical protein
MHHEQFDALARAFGRGTTRRQVLKGLAIGAGAHLLAATGLAGRPAAAYAAPGDGLFLPLIVGNGVAICTAASTCEQKVYCSDDRDCLCIQTAEGSILPGQYPTCAAQRCATSADCANLGPGYFCDSPGSGCCDDGEQRCLAPFDAVCPEERICGSVCCAKDEICSSGRCVDPATGTWTGAISYEGQTIGVRFILAHDNGELTGRMLMEDPMSKVYLETGEILYGEFTRDWAYWQTVAETVIEGAFAGASFTGAVYFPARHEEDGFDAQIALERTGD